MESFACHLQRHEAGLMRHRVLTGLGSPAAQLAPAACSGQTAAAETSTVQAEQSQHASTSGRVLFFKLSAEELAAAQQHSAATLEDSRRQGAGAPQAELQPLLTRLGCSGNVTSVSGHAAAAARQDARGRAEEIVGRIERLETAGDHSFSRHPLAVAARAALKADIRQGQDGATLLLQVALQARGAAAAMLLSGDQTGIHAKLVRQAPGCPIPASGVMDGASVAALLQAGGLLQAATLSGGDLALGYVEDAAAAAGEELLVLSPETLRQVIARGGVPAGPMTTPARGYTPPDFYTHMPGGTAAWSTPALIRSRL